VLPNSQESTYSHSPSKDAMFLVLYKELQSNTGRFHTFPNFENYHEISFSLNGGTMPHQDIRNHVNYLLPSYLDFHSIKI
jgi:hypothetical protein